MSTILFNEIVFGPIQSRRLGISLGINLLPYDGKLCSFNCIYCECGYNEDFKTKTKLPDRETTKAALENKLVKLINQNVIPDVITFAGNGEPTMHPDFGHIIDDAIELRNKYIPTAKISVLSNGMHIDKKEVVEALKKVDNNILKLDSGKIDTIRLIDQPNSKQYSVAKQIELFKQFDGKFILQTMFVRGSHNGYEVDNTTEDEIEAWLEVVVATQPNEVMIYSIDRQTPEKHLEKVPLADLKKIAEKVEKLGIKINIAG